MAASSGGKSSLPERVGALYYSLGLVITTYPTTLITLAIALVLLSCYPLLHLPLLTTFSVGVNSTHTSPVYCFIQQVVVRGAVVPWTPGLRLADAFRAPLYEVFSVLDLVRDFQRHGTGLQHLCLHVEAVKAGSGILPEYQCLVLSPANFWGQDPGKFAEDGMLLNTIFNHQNLQKGKTSVAELLFGMNLKEAGIKRYPLRNRQRILQYAITVVYKHYDPQFIADLRQKLESLYPLHQPNTTNTEISNTTEAEDIVYIYFPGVMNYVEFVPLAITYLILFFYIYFSVRKIEIIKSKVGMAFAAVVTVLGSLLMSVGLCFFFGLTLSMQGKEIFPYLVILVGLENVLVLTKSVVTTPQHLDVKIRIAQGLSKEGWSITKNILVEITILTIGLMTFVPVIQEFCIFAITGLISDFFLQMFFFSTILGIDIHRMEISSEKTHTSFRNPLYQTQGMYDSSRVISRTLPRSKSHPRLSTVGTHTLASGTHNHSQDRIPKRLRLVNIWARTRFFQRAFMVWMVVWISIIVYNSGIVDLKTSRGNAAPRTHNTKGSRLLSNHTSVSISPNPVPPLANGASISILLGPAVWPQPPAQHWPALFSRYNVSLAGARVALLPSIRLGLAVSPHTAEMRRHPSEWNTEGFRWPALAAALDPIDFYEHSNKQPHPQTQPFIPNSPMEILLTLILCFISVIVLAYSVFVLYRCICSRNYAEWRASWSEKEDTTTVSSAAHLVMDAVPMVLEGHTQEVECLVTDGRKVVSSCLGGKIKVWDAETGEAVSGIDRRSYFGLPSTSPPLEDDSMLSDYESGSPPSRDEHSMSFPSLQAKINTNFANLKLEPTESTSTGTRSRSYDFGEQYRQLYLDHEDTGMRHRGSETARWIINQASNNLSRKSIGVRKSSSVEDCSSPPPIWCMDYLDNLIVLGCANGRLEFWEGTSGKLKCIWEDGSGLGVTSLKIVGSRVVVAKLNGSLDFLQLQSYSQGRQIDWCFTSAYRRTHVRSGSTGSLADYPTSCEDLRCVRVSACKAHGQPVSVLDAEGGRVLSGSQDHTLRVFRLEDATALYTLHGHCGPITCAFIDRVMPNTAGSGSQDGLLCVWDLTTGFCMYSLQAHDGSITSLTYSSSYVISVGTDERLCVWERFQGHLLSSIALGCGYCAPALMLTHHLLVTARHGSLAVIDLRTGDTCRTVQLGHQDDRVFVKQALLLRDGSVVTDYGKELRVVRFPLIAHKLE